MSKLFETPILFVTFNRPDTVQAVLNEIMKVRPAKLYIAQDGPRKSKPGEAERCRAVREIFNQINPDCDVKTLFREHNLGCGETVSSAINWFFQNVEEGIILEDDCLPHPDFFRFCQEMLEKYRNNEKIMHISGDNFNFGDQAGSGSYYFSKFVYCWGWATWRRAWRYFDITMKTWPEFVKQNRMFGISKDRRLRERWIDILQAACKIDGWDYQWIYAIWNQNGLSVYPNVNLISNIGFGENASHTLDKNSKSANIKSCGIGKIVHPLLVQRAEEDDELYRKTSLPSLAERIKSERKRQTLKVILPIPETLLKLFLSSINPKRTRHKAYAYKVQAKYFFCMLIYKTLGKNSAVRLAEIIEPIEE